MGDGGSNFLGYSLALIGIICSSNNEFSINRLQVSLIIALPIYYMIFVIAKRILTGNSPFLPDRGHFHHLLLNKGFSQKNILNFYLFMSIISLSVGIVLT